MTTSESWAICAAFIGSGISWLGPGVWQQHYPLPGNGWGASVDWLLAMLPGICGSGRCQLVHVGLSTAGARMRTYSDQDTWICGEFKH